MPTYQGMPNVAEALEGPWARSPSGAVKALGSHRVTGAAGDDGAIMAYMDDGGRFHAEFQHYGSTLAAVSARSRSGLLPFLKAWWPAMRYLELAPSETPTPADVRASAAPKKRSKSFQDDQDPPTRTDVPAGGGS